MTKSNLPSLVLMIISLILLFMFLVIWNKENYQAAQQILYKESNLLLQEAVTEVQDSNLVLFLETYFVASDTQKVVTIMAEKKVQSFENLETLEIKSLTDSAHHISGDIAEITVKVDAGDSPLDTAVLANHFPSIFHESFASDSLIIQRFEQKLGLTEWPKDYVINEKVDSSFIEKNSPKSLRFSLKRDREITFQNAHWYLLEKIEKPLLFSCFLFGIISLAFVSLYRSNQRISLYNQMKNDFISNMTHELQTPITTVGVALESIEGLIQEKQENKAIEYLQISQHELHRLSFLVDKVMNLSLFEQHSQQPLRLGKVDLVQLVEEATQALKVQMEASKGVCLVESDAESHWVNGDAVHLTNVFLNLLENSLKYATEPPHIQLQLSSFKECTIIRVKDNGIGIPAPYQQKIFERFFRVPTGNEHNVKGYGLGLSYVAAIIAQHGGKIAINSKQGEGTEFVIQIPIYNE